MGIPFASLFLGTKDPVRIETTLSRTDAIARLDAQIVPFGHEGLRGTASEAGLSLYVVNGPVRRNAWRPVFEGRLEATPSGSVLVGTIGLDVLVRFVVVLLMLTSLVVFVRELVGLLRGISTESSILHASKWLLVFPGAAIFNYIGRLASSEEEQKLRELLLWTLKNHVG